MARITTTNVLVGLFLVLVLILFVTPSLLRNLYSNSLGRMSLILVVLFFAMHNITLGLFSALIVIIAANMFISEGLDNMDTTTITPVRNAIKEKVDANQVNQTNQVNTTPTSGIDLETIKNSIQSQASSSLPTNPPTSTENVSPSSTEPFRSMYSTL